MFAEAAMDVKTVRVCLGRTVLRQEGLWVTAHREPCMVSSRALVQACGGIFAGKGSSGVCRMSSIGRVEQVSAAMGRRQGLPCCCMSSCECGSCRGGSDSPKSSTGRGDTVQGALQGERRGRKGREGRARDCPRDRACKGPRMRKEAVVWRSRGRFSSYQCRGEGEKGAAGPAAGVEAGRAAVSASLPAQPLSRAAAAAAAVGGSLCRRKRAGWRAAGGGEEEEEGTEVKAAQEGASVQCLKCCVAVRGEKENKGRGWVWEESLLPFACASLRTSLRND